MYKFSSKDKLQGIFERIHSYYHSWKLNINITKCETILFRPSLLSAANRDLKRFYKTFTIRESLPNGQPIPHKKYLKYLGIHIDEKLKFNNHIDIQLTKARKAFLIHKRLFHSKYLHQKN